MKNSSIKEVIFAVAATGFVLFALHTVTERNNTTAENNAAMTDMVTMGSIQNDLREYLNKNHPEIRFGSKKYIEYVTEVCLYDGDPELAKLENYEDIQFYCAEYLHELDEQQVKGMIPFIGFKPSEEFLSKTIEEIQSEVIAKERQNEIEY